MNNGKKKNDVAKWYGSIKLVSTFAGPPRLRVGGLGMGTCPSKGASKTMTTFKGLSMAEKFIFLLFSVHVSIRFFEL